MFIVTCRITAAIKTYNSTRDYNVEMGGSDHFWKIQEVIQMYPSIGHSIYRGGISLYSPCKLLRRISTSSLIANSNYFEEIKLERTLRQSVHTTLACSHFNIFPNNYMVLKPIERYISWPSQLTGPRIHAKYFYFICSRENNNMNPYSKPEPLIRFIGEIPFYAFRMS